MRIALIAIQIAVAALPAAAGDALAGLVDASCVAQLRAGRDVTRSVGADGALGLLPRAAAPDGIAQDMAAMRPTIGLEMLRSLDPGRDSFGGADWLRVYNVLNAVSTMEGIPYWSVSRGRQETLFSTSYAVASATDNSRVPDPVWVSVPRESTLHTVQQDRSFGRNTYEERFTFTGDRLSVRIENLTPVSLVLVPVVKPRAFVVRIVFLPAGDRLLAYGVAALRTSFPLGDHAQREESLGNRLVAMLDWLQDSLSAR